MNLNNVKEAGRAANRIDLLNGKLRTLRKMQKFIDVDLGIYAYGEEGYSGDSFSVTKIFSGTEDKGASYLEIPNDKENKRYRKVIVDSLIFEMEKEVLELENKILKLT